jgi:hypothetical protein
MIEIRRRISTPFSGASGVPTTVAEPEDGASRGAERPHRGRLAGALGAEKSERLAVADLEGDPLERDPVAEPLAQIMNRERPAAGLRAIVAGHHAAFPWLDAPPWSRYHSPPGS